MITIVGFQRRILFQVLLGSYFGAVFGRQDGSKIDPKNLLEPIPKTTFQNDPNALNQ